VTDQTEFISPNDCGVETSPYPPREDFTPPTSKQIVQDTELPPDEEYVQKRKPALDSD
jgi:hypothetical protein